MKWWTPVIVVLIIIGTGGWWGVTVERDNTELTYKLTERNYTIDSLQQIIYKYIK